jgi:hypothetical protein
MSVEGSVMLTSAASVKSEFTNLNGIILNVGGSTVDSDFSNGNGRSGRAGSTAGNSVSPNITEGVSCSEGNSSGTDVMIVDGSAGGCKEASSSALFVTFVENIISLRFGIFLTLLPSGFLNSLVIDCNISELIVYLGI